MANPSLSKSATFKILVVDDHEIVLGGTIDLLKQQYPDAEIFTAQTARSTLEQVQKVSPDLVVMDLSIPETEAETARIDTGIQVLRTLMQTYSNLNLTVQSTYVRSLVRIRPEIDAHKGGFTAIDKSLSSQDMLTRLEWARQGVTHTKDIQGVQTGLEVKPEWLTLLSLAFGEGLQDKTIAKRMQVSERTVRHYWTKVQDVLEVYPEEGKNIRIQTEMRAREEGLID